MKISASILDCEDRVCGVIKLNRTNISYIHVDVMDGEFVFNTQFREIKEICAIHRVSKYPLDVHLMVKNPIDYVEQLGNMNIEFITVHLEIEKGIREVVSKIKALGYKVGLSIKPSTSVKEIEPYLNEIDLVLLMSVEPGIGGQKFMDSTIDRVLELKNLIDKSNRDILIEVDGGINDMNIAKLKNVDIAVVGSYITKSDNYDERVGLLLKNIDG